MQQVSNDEYAEMPRQLPKRMHAKWTLSYHESRHCYLGNTNTDKGKLKVETTEYRRRKLNELLSNLMQKEPLSLLFTCRLSSWSKNTNLLLKTCDRSVYNYTCYSQPREILYVWNSQVPISYKLTFCFLEELS